MVMQNQRNEGLAATTEKYRDKFDMMVVNRMGESKMSNVHFRNMLGRLQSMGVITISFDKKTWDEWIRFDINNEEACQALKENDICAKVLST